MQDYYINNLLLLKIWKTCLPHIVIALPRSDVCARCELNKRALVDAVTDQECLDAAGAVKDHIQVYILKYKANRTKHIDACICTCIAIIV